MTEHEANMQFSFLQTIPYRQGKIKVYFDVKFDDETPYISPDSQVFYQAVNITKIMELCEIDELINWTRVQEESKSY